jgi:hypothetical protein
MVEDMIELQLPELPKGWLWNVKLREHDYGLGPETLMEIRAEKGIYVSQDRKEYASEVFSTGDFALGRYKDYDHLVNQVQKSVNELADRVTSSVYHRETVEDAVKHILEVFASNSLHLEGHE